MNQQDTLVKVAAAVASLYDSDGAPESTLYLGLCQMNMDEWTKLRYVLIEAKLISIKGNWVTLTPYGEEMGNKLESLVR